MNCKYVRKYIGDYQSGVLDSELHELVDHHLAHCADCREYLKQEQSVSSFLHSTEISDQTVSDLASTVLERLSAEDEPEDSPVEPGRVSHRVSWSLIAALVVMFILIGLFVFPFSSSEDRLHSAYGPVGFTWMGVDPAGETGKETEDVSGILGSETLNIYTGTDLPEDSGRITHSFDLSVKQATPVISSSEEDK